MRTTDLVHPPFPSASRLSWTSSASTSSSDGELSYTAEVSRCYSTYSSTLAALVRPECRSDEAHLRKVVDAYINSKLRKSKDVKKVARKLDLLEKNLLHMEIPLLPNVFARCRSLHGIPVTDSTLPSSGPTRPLGAEIPGLRGSTITFAY